MKNTYSLEYIGAALETETGTWHDFRVVAGGEEIATCCMFVWSVDGETDEDGSESEAGSPDHNGLHYGDGADRPSSDHSDIDLSDLQSKALALI